MGVLKTFPTHECRWFKYLDICPAMFGISTFEPFVLCIVRGLTIYIFITWGILKMDLCTLAFPGPVLSVLGACLSAFLSPGFRNSKIIKEDLFDWI